MKTTLNIEPDLYAAAEQLARSQQKSVGQLVTELLRRALGAGPGFDASTIAELERRNGFVVFPERPGPQVTIEDVQKLSREEGI